MIKEALVTLAEIAFFAKVIPIKRGPVFHTAAATDRQVSAYKTFITEILLGPCKGSFFAADGQLIYRRFKNVTQLPSRLNKKITAESITVMFNNNVLTALSVECANRVPARNVIRQERIKIANAQLLRPIFVPAVKYPAQEFTILLRCNCKIRNLIRAGFKLYAGDKLYIPCPKGDEEIKYLVRILYVFCV